MFSNGYKESRQNVVKSFSLPSKLKIDGNTDEDLVTNEES